MRRVYNVSATHGSHISLSLAKQILPFAKIVIAGGPGTEKEIGRFVSFITTAMPESEKIYFAHFNVPKAASLLDSCLAHHALLLVNCYIPRRGDCTVSLATGDRREMFVSKIMKSSMQSKFTLLFWVLTPRAPD